MEEARKFHINIYFFFIDYTKAVDCVDPQETVEKFAVWLRELKPVLYDNLEGWDGAGEGRRLKREGTYVYLWLIYVDVWQKPTQYCKEIIRQLKINKLRKKELNKKNE